MPATFNIELHFSLPPSLSPELVIQNLHAYEPLIRPNPYLQGFTRLPVDLDEVVADPFFTQDGTNIVSYEIHDRIPVIAFLGVTKDVKFPAIFQSFATGVRLRADAAAGTRVRSIYEVCRREVAGQGLMPHTAAFEGARPAAPGQGEWDLVERSHVECNALLKPFVMKSFEAAHRDLCQKVIDNIMGVTQKDLPPLPHEAR